MTRSPADIAKDLLIAAEGLTIVGYDASLLREAADALDRAAENEEPARLIGTHAKRLYDRLEAAEKVCGDREGPSHNPWPTQRTGGAQTP